MRQPSVVSAEHSFFRVLQRELEERGAKVTWYEGLLVAQGNAPDNLMISAHIDRHGLICTGPQEYQYAAFIAANRSELLNTAVSEHLMNKITERYIALPVYAYEPWSGMYRGNGVITHSYICPFRNNLIFEIDQLDGVIAGTPVAFKDKLVVNEDTLQGQFDNVLTASVLVHLFSMGFQGTAFFTAQEEAGKSWRFLLEWFNRYNKSTDRLIVVDTSPFQDLETINDFQLVLREKDANAGFNQHLTQSIKQVCDSLGFNYVFKDSYVESKNKELVHEGKSPKTLGSTEMGRVIAGSNGRVDGTTIQVPTTHYHTMNETTTEISISSFIQLLNVLAQDSGALAKNGSS